MNVREIVEAYLTKHGFDGLCDMDPAEPCGCEIGDLAPCECDVMSCEPGYKHPCDCGEGCKFHMLTEMPQVEEADTLEIGDRIEIVYNKYCPESVGKQGIVVGFNGDRIDLRIEDGSGGYDASAPRHELRKVEPC